MDSKVWTAMGAIGSLLAGVGAIWAVTRADGPAGQPASVAPTVTGNGQTLSTAPSQPQPIPANDDQMTEAINGDPIVADVPPDTTGDRPVSTPLLNGRWGGTVTWEDGSHWWDFYADGTFIESGGYRGTWSQSGTQVTWVYPRGTRYYAEIRGDHLTGRRYRQDGAFGGTFTLGRID